MREQPILFRAPMIRALLAGQKKQTRRVVKLKNGQYMPPSEQADRPGWRQMLRLCPYGQPGDHLWVRETWATDISLDQKSPKNFKAWPVRYEADGAILKHGSFYGSANGKVRPSIFMPRWASRILLEITDIRVERLQDISEADAIAEGVKHCEPELDTGGHWYSPEELYSMLWTKIHGWDNNGWNANPWVWVVEFQIVQKASA